MKKTITLLFIIMLLTYNGFSVLANPHSAVLFCYDKTEKRYEYAVDIEISDFELQNGETAELMIGEDDICRETLEKFLSVTENGERFIFLDLKTENEENPYPELSQQMNVNIMHLQPGGGRDNRIGKDYRLFYASENSFEIEDITEKIVAESYHEVSFNTDKLGKYAVIFNPSVYDVIFYSEMAEYDDECNMITPECIYMEIPDLQEKDIIVFPEIPEKENYIFTGWKVWRGSGIYFAEPQPFTALDYYEYYASWCLEDEYEPINIEISSSEPITRGEESGKKITLKTNYGIFVKDDEFPVEWRTVYDSETDEQTKADILSDWKSKWNIVGSDDVIIETATRIDDKTVEFTLSGNSRDKYSNADIHIEFDSYLLMPEPYERNGEIIDWDDTKIKMDADGVRARMYRSDNAVTLLKQSRPSTGGGITRYTVAFETNGGSDISKQTVKRNATAKEPQQPQKDDYNFAGWFTDEELTTEFDFTTKITKNIKLYAKWDVADKAKDQIIFAVGKTEASVFGEAKQNDVAPVIYGDRAFLPARFVAESLGAVVKWDNDTRTVTITKDDIIIIITIDAETAIVNGEEIVLDYPAFIENDRTYTPIRFVAEKLGRTVEWNDSTGEIIIK